MGARQRHRCVSRRIFEKSKRRDRRYQKESPDEQAEPPRAPQIAGWAPIEHRLARSWLLGRSQPCAPVFLLTRPLLPENLHHIVDAGFRWGSLGVFIPGRRLNLLNGAGVKAERYLIVDAFDNDRERSDLNGVTFGEHIAFFSTEKPAVKRKDIRRRKIRE